MKLKDVVEDYTFSKVMSVDELVMQMEKAWGFTAGKLAVGVKILERMNTEKGCVKFLSFTGNLVATGTRGAIRELVKRKLVDVVITTCGALDHDIARCWKKYYKGSFVMNDSKLREAGVNRLGNILVPNDSYGVIIEKKMCIVLEGLWTERIKEVSSSQLCKEIGQRICNETSILYWAAKNSIPVYVPSKDEIGRLAASFNKMATDLKGHRDHLEELVEERTAGLIRANEQLQREITERKQVEEKLIVYQDQLRSMASELSLTEERERRRIAADLHDHIGQSLAISKIQLGALRKVLFSSELARSIDKIYELITQTIQDTRSLIFELSPPILYELGIEAAVEWLAEQIKEQHNIMVEFEDDNQSKPLDDDIRVLLFQAVRELLVNVVKHSQARKAKVSVQKDGGNIRIHVEDNGIGFDSSKIYSYSDRTRGFGLFSIRERLDYLGGYFTIASEPGYGTRVTLGAPLKNNKESIKGKLHEHKDSLS